MLKQIIILIVLSIAIILFTSYAHQGIQALINIHDWIAHLLTAVFSSGHAGNLARGLIALISVPILVGFIPVILYWLVKRHWFPYFMQVVWIVWLIQASALVVYKTVA